MGEVLILGGAGGADTSVVTAEGSDVLTGKRIVDAYGEVQPGTIPKKAASTLVHSNSDAELKNGSAASGFYLSGPQTIRATKVSGLDGAKMLRDLTIKVGDDADDDRIANESGTIPSTTSELNYPVVSGDDNTIPGNKYLAHILKIRGVTTSGISAENIKVGVTVKVGHANDAGAIKNVTGNYTGDGTVTATNDVRYGYIAYSNGTKYIGIHNPTSAIPWT